MPEYHDVLACFLTARRWFDSVRGKEDLTLHKLWADLAETGETKGGGRTADWSKYVRVLDPTICGTEISANASIYPPPQWRGPNARPLKSMHLEDVKSTPRTVVINLGECYLQVWIDDHVLCQAFTRRQWDHDICRSTRDGRGFAVALAVDFGPAGVLAFLTPNNIISIKVCWSRKPEKLACRSPDVYTEYNNFLRGVASWILQRNDFKATFRHGLAMEAIFSAQDVFAGMGPATANEIFYLAGLSPFLTEYEVFSCPSRVARLCEAFWTFAHNARTQLPLLLNACYHGCVLAATKEQRLRFYESFHVYGKQQTTMSVRMHELRNRYIERLRNRAGRSHIAFLRNAVGGFFDVFEPSYLQPAFNKPGPSPNLAHLVFGPMEWCINGGRLPEPRDPLYVLFYNTLDMQPDDPTNLELSLYRKRPCLSEEKLTKVQVPCELYQGSISFWSITPSIQLDDRTALLLLGTKVPEYRLVPDCTPYTAKHVIQHTDKHFVGPLEHCGVARLVPQPGAEPTLAICRVPPPPLPPLPRIPHRDLAAEARTPTPAKRKTQPKRCTLDFTVVPRPDFADDAQPSSKRPRLSVDGAVQRRPKENEAGNASACTIC